MQHKETLLRPESSMHLLLNTLRKLDCYRLQLSDLSGTEIGRAAATLAAHHPRQVRTGLCMLPSLAAVPAWHCSRACCPTHRTAGALADVNLTPTCAHPPTHSCSRPPACRRWRGWRGRWLTSGVCRGMASCSASSNTTQRRQQWRQRGTQRTSNWWRPRRRRPRSRRRSSRHGCSRRARTGPLGSRCALCLAGWLACWLAACMWGVLWLCLHGRHATLKPASKACLLLVLCCQLGAVVAACLPTPPGCNSC